MKTDPRIDEVLHFWFVENGYQQGFAKDLAFDARIARFGRFPHRKAILDRASTPEEVAYLATSGSGF